MPDLDKSKVTLALVALIVVFAVSATSATVWYLARIDMRLARLEAHIPADWTLMDQVVWSGQLKDANPALKVPQPIQSPKQQAQ